MSVTLRVQFVNSRHVLCFYWCSNICTHSARDRVFTTDTRLILSSRWLFSSKDTTPARRSAGTDGADAPALKEQEQPQPQVRTGGWSLSTPSQICSSSPQRWG